MSDKPSRQWACGLSRTDLIARIEQAESRHFAMGYQRGAKDAIEGVRLRLAAAERDVRQLDVCLSDTKLSLEAAETLVADLEQLVYAPGQWRCAKCEFTLQQKNLHMNGAVTARDQPGDKCPNCKSPLWRVTEREYADEMGKTVEWAMCEREAAQKDAARYRWLRDGRRMEFGIQPGDPENPPRHTWIYYTDLTHDSLEEIDGLVDACMKTTAELAKERG